MEYIIETMLEPVVTIAVSIVTAVVAAGGAALVKFITSRTKNEKLVEYAELLSFYAQKSVNYVAQTQGDLIKELAADGEFSDDDKRILKAAAIARTKEIAPDAILAFQTKANSDLDAFIETLVESAVREGEGTTGTGE